MRPRWPSTDAPCTAPIEVANTDAGFPHALFRAYDIRGATPEPLSVELAERIGRALGEVAIERDAKQLALGRDGRVSSPAISEAVTRGLCAAGCELFDLGAVPTPFVYFAARELELGSGVQITGSHNPAADNGLKMQIAGETLSSEAIQDLKARVLKGPSRPRVEGSSRPHDIFPAYREAVCADIPLARPLHVVLDSGNGIAGAFAPALFRALGCRVDELYSEVDGRFPNHHPDPTQPDNLRTLIDTVRAGGADVGLAFDGDGDRLGVVSPAGDIIWPDRQMLLFAAHILAERPGSEILFDVKCSRRLGEGIRAAGGRATLARTGHAFMKNQLRASGAALAGEMSGHLFFNDRWGGFDDALYAGARLCQLLADDPRTAAEIFATLPDSINTPELRLDMAEGEQHALAAELCEAADFPDAEIHLLDGLRADFADGFGLARASNTTPALILRFEGDDEAALERIQSQFRDLIRRLRPNLALPF